LSFSDWKNKKTANSNKQLTIEMNQAIWQLYKFGRFYLRKAYADFFVKDGRVEVEQKICNQR